MAETACLTAYSSASLPPSGRDLPPFPTGSPLPHHHGYANGNVTSGYVSNSNGVAGAATKSSSATSVTLSAAPSSNTVPAANGSTNTPAAPSNNIQSFNVACLSIGAASNVQSSAKGNYGGAAAAGQLQAATLSAGQIHGTKSAANGTANANGDQNITGNGKPHGATSGGKPTHVAVNPNYGGQQPFHQQFNGGATGQMELPAEVRRPTLWYEEEIDENLRWCFGLVSILHTGVSKYQEIALLDTLSFGKVLTLDRKMQSAEKDEWVYHECLVHPALLLHASPKNVFIMGGGEGSTAREALRHKSVRKVVMCDIDEEVVKFCGAHLTMNREAFQSSKLELVINDARAELESRQERFDIIVGDLADPMEGGPSYQLYSKGFYDTVVKPKLNPGGIFVTQAGPAGILSHKEVFTSIFNTLRHVFAHVVAYAAHVPSYADTWGWVMASDQPFSQLSSEELDARIKQRVKGDLLYLDGATLHASSVLNKAVRKSLLNETHVYTEDSARFVYGHGRRSGGF